MDPRKQIVDPMLADLMERFNTPQNKSRYSAGIFDSNAPGEVRSVTPTVKERMASGLQAAIESAGSDRYKARQRAQTILGGPNSRLPGGFGVADIVAMVNPTVAAGMIPVYAESAMHDLANVPNALKRGDYIGAGVDTAFGLMDLIPAVGQGKRVAKGVAKGIKNAVTSDAGYNLAQQVLNATGTAPMQIMMGPMSKTWRKADADLAVKMEGEGRSANDIWRKTGTFRAPDGKLRQEIPDIDMRYTSGEVEKKQYTSAKKRHEQAKARATTLEELNDANEHWNKTRTDAIFNLIGKAQDFVNHPELFAAYPELAKYAFKQLEPTHNQFTAPETVYGFYSPTNRRVTINTDAPYKRSTALHELQHAIQEIEGWQGGSNPEYITAKMAERDIAKKEAKEIQDRIDNMKATDPVLYEDLIRNEEGALGQRQYLLNQTSPLEGVTDPYETYKKMSGEEEARMVQARRDYDERQRQDSLPIWNYETSPSEQITKDFATGGAVMMAGGKDATKEAIKQGVKTAVNTVDDFIKKLYGNKPTGEVNYVTAQEGPFFRINPSGVGEGQASRTGVREVTGTGEGVGSGGTGAVRGKVAKRYSPEEVARLVRENNIARRAAQKFGGSHNAPMTMPATSLHKQGAIGRAFMEASTDNPQYKQAVYEAYGRQMPELMETIGARDYDDLMDKAYRQLNYETEQQFNQMPVNMSFHRAGEGDYRSSKEMLEDVHGNQHLYVFQGGEPHNMMSDVDPRTGLNQTEKFRAVHDLFGHAVHGNEFGPKGEELAFGAHSQMYSPLARIALATETRGQNSVVNYTPLNVELKAELAKLDALRHEAMRRGDEGLANEIAQQKRALYGENFQYSPNRGLLLPPEFTDPMFEGGLPEYMSGIFRPSQGASERLTHFSHDPSLTMTDPSRYGTGIRGEEMYRLQGSKAPVMDRTYFYRGDNPRPETGLGRYRYGTQGEDLYSMASDPERLGLLARESNRMPFTARSNQGLINEDQALTDFERLAKEYGYEGLLGDRAGIMYNPAAVERYADGGEVHMAPGGGAKEAAKKGVKQAVDAVSDFLNSLKPGEKPATAADRAAAGRQADAMIQATPQVKASEALGQAMEKGFKKVSTTQSDRTRVGKGNIGGANFPALSNASPIYANKVWGVMDSGTANRLINLSSPETLWSTVLGSADQLKSNPVVFSKLKKQFIDQMNAGMLHPELEGKINQNLAVLLGEGADIRDPKIWNLMDTFNKRGAMADIMAGKGLPPEEGGVALGGAKGQIFNPTPTLIKETELGLLHPEHGGYVPTYAVGPRLFTLSGQKEYRPDLHTGFPTLLTGQDQGVNMMTTPTEIFLPDWHQNFKKYIAEKNAEKALLGIKPRTRPASYFDLTLGLPDQGLPSQDLNNAYIQHLIREGYAEGGEVHMDKGGAAKDAVKAAVKEAAEALRGYVDPIATKISNWNWRPMSDVRQDVPLTEIPEYIQGGFGNFMAEQAKRAADNDLNARDLIKAYTITRSSVNRGGLPYNTATKTGMKLPRTTEKLVRPEGAFAEWLGSRAGQRYLDDAVLGKFDEKDLEDMVTRFSPFGMPAVLADDMRYAARTLSPKGPTISAEITAPADVYRDTSQQIKGIGPAKSGFMASLLGRGDFPTFDVRQINLHTGEGGKQAKKYLARGYGEGGEEAVARLADRQRAMNMSIDPALAPFYQHLTHHAVWDALDNSQVTHNDLMKAMRGYADGGEVDLDGVTLDDFLSKQGY